MPAVGIGGARPAPISPSFSAPKPASPPSFSSPKPPPYTPSTPKGPPPPYSPKDPNPAKGPKPASPKSGSPKVKPPKVKPPKSSTPGPVVAPAPGNHHHGNGYGAISAGSALQPQGFSGLMLVVLVLMVFLGVRRH